MLDKMTDEVAAWHEEEVDKARGECPDWLKCIGDAQSSLCGETGRTWRFVDVDHALQTVANKGRQVPCGLCLAVAMGKCAAAERERLAKRVEAEWPASFARPEVAEWLRAGGEAP